jgi:uncharacterized membrane protein YhaH (DUF805 family)
VNRRQYLLHGTALMVFKYAIDAVVIGIASGRAWAPWAYLMTSPLQLSQKLGKHPDYLGPLLALWTLPFIWIGVCMTARRLIDADWSPWWSLLFFVPPLSYGLMVFLALWPSRERETPPRPEIAGQKMPASVRAIAAGASLGMLLLFIGGVSINSYGVAMFLGTPFAVGALSAYVLNRSYRATLSEMCQVVILTMVLIGGAALAVGWEGAICIVLAFPLSALVGLMGGALGQFAANEGVALYSVALMPAIVGTGLGMQAGVPDDSVLREVRSSVEINAAPELVWPNVIAFPGLPKPTELYFRLGVAYPMHARIVGQGVGAVRYCEFSTGPFVEPITDWEPGRRLAFDVVSSPQPLKELSPYDIKPPHLHGFLTPSRGEFRLIALPDGSTRLEGSTWYRQSLRPEVYWVAFSDYLIHRIHERVLTHIKKVTEEGGNTR